MQVQLLTLVLLTGDVEPDGHATHEVIPGVLPYVPGLQAVQLLAPALSACVPASHEMHVFAETDGGRWPHAQQASSAYME